MFYISNLCLIFTRYLSDACAFKSLPIKKAWKLSYFLIWQFHFPLISEKNHQTSKGLFDTYVLLGERVTRFSANPRFAPIRAHRAWTKGQQWTRFHVASMLSAWVELITAVQSKFSIKGWKEIGNVCLYIWIFLNESENAGVEQYYLQDRTVYKSKL